MTAGTLSLKSYLIVFGMLVVLTVVTTGVAYVDLGFFNVIVALTIAISKALLVVMFFMHLAHSAHRTQVVAGAGILWLLILITFTVSDVLTRSWISSPTGW
jgi:cytochrome c oxidase subunit IV